MSQIQTILKTLGLTETEVNIYLSGLAFPSIGATELSKQTSIKRPTVYHALETLMQKGLVSKKGTGSKVVFSMTPPKNIKKLVDQKIDGLEKQKTALDELIPLLEQRHGSKIEQMSVAHYEGIDGIKLVVEEALYCKSRHWDIIAPRKNFFSEFDTAYSNYYLETRKRRKLTARTLWEKGLPIKKKLNKEEIRQRQPRYLPKSMEGNFKSVIILFDDKVAIISSLKTLSAVLITSEEIHNTFSAMFEGLWNTSLPYEKMQQFLTK